METQYLGMELRTFWSEESSYPNDERPSALCLWVRVNNAYNTLIHTHPHPLKIVKLVKKSEKTLFRRASIIVVWNSEQTKRYPCESEQLYPRFAPYLYNMGH